MFMDKLLVICGPTATGKTSLGIDLAKKFDGEIVSADSRQVYVGLDIGTGKDLPKGSKSHRSKLRFKNSYIVYYEINGVRIWGYDLVGPKDKFSVGEYSRVAKVIITDIWKREKLPIVVGGTGLYIKSITDGIPTSQIPPNYKLRKRLDKKGRDELFELLRVNDPIKAASLNASDKKNPRRLIRAIEISEVNNRSRPTNDVLSIGSMCFIGLKSPRELLNERISMRVDVRLKKGVEDEIKRLFDMGVDWEDQSMTSLGYAQWRPYFVGEIERCDAVDSWKLAEKRFSKRQMTWFKRDRRVNWFDVSSKDWHKQVESLMDKWYN